MTLPVRLTEQAEADVLDIWQYIADDNEVAADKLIDRFSETCEKLARNPQMGIRQEKYRPGLRCFPVGKYVIFYSVTSEDLEVYRVLHGARRLEDLL